MEKASPTEVESAVVGGRTRLSLKVGLVEGIAVVVADNDNDEDDVNDDDMLQMAHFWLNVFVSLITHFLKGADVLGQTNAGSNATCDLPRKGARETIQQVEIQKQATVKMS